MKDTFNRIGLNIALTQILSSGFILKFSDLTFQRDNVEGKKTEKRDKREKGC